MQIIRGYTEPPAGSVLVRAGRTHVLCTASIVEDVPEWRAASNHGWVTAEYDMLPGATPDRRKRSRAKVDGRAQEIQRLIGRSLRSVVNMSVLGPRTIYIDCDVLQADGGTRTAAITGAFVALYDALAVGQERSWWTSAALTGGVAAVSVGIVNGELLLDLNYQEDVAAEVDCNLVMTTEGAWVEVQATAEGKPYSAEQLAAMCDLGRRGIQQLFEIQQAAMAEPLGPGA